MWEGVGGKGNLVGVDGGNLLIITLVKAALTGIIKKKWGLAWDIFVLF